MSTPVATPENQIVAAAQTPSGSEMAQLSTAIQEWKRVHDELVELRQESREKGKRVKVLEDVIMRIMKKNNIGALDLKSSGGRLLYKRKAAKSGLNPKVLLKTLTEHLKSDTKAAEAVTYITNNRESKVRESLTYEVNAPIE
jgi:hypothetical protein